MSNSALQKTFTASGAAKLELSSEADIRPSHREYNANPSSLQDNNKPSITSLLAENPATKNELSQTHKSKDGLRLNSINKISSDHQQPQLANGSHIIKRFMSSESCSSQSILCRSSQSEDDRYRDGDPRSFTSNALSQDQESVQPVQKQFLEPMDSLHLRKNHESFYSCSNKTQEQYQYARNVFYAPKQKVMYQSLVQKPQSSSENLTGLSETNRDGERKEEVNKSRNTPIAKSQTGVQNDRTSKSGFPNSEIELQERTKQIVRKILMEMPPLELTSVKRYYSLKPDMAFGWRPEDIHGAPIPMHFDYEQNDIPTNPETGLDYPVYFIGNRFTDSLDMHRRFANKAKMLGPDEIPSYHFKFPPNQNIMDAIGHQSFLDRKNAEPSVTKIFNGMSPLLTESSVEQALPLLKGYGKDFDHEFFVRTMANLKQMAGPKDQHLLFDSAFESGNLDMVIQIAPDEYDMYMRVDSNTRGHHQWFYFKVQNQNKVGTVKFNFVNFTKRQSLYCQGMRVNSRSMLDVAEQKSKLPAGTPVTKLTSEGWVKCGDNISYKLSKLSRDPNCYASNKSYAADPSLRARGRRKYYMLSFEYTFKKPNDETYIAYAIPYTVSKLHNFLKEIMAEHDSKVIELEERQQGEIDQNSNTVFQPYLRKPSPTALSEHAFIKESKFCYSLSGLEVPQLTITSQVARLSGQPEGAPLEIDPAEFDENCKLPTYKYKKYMIIGARVHPGESNASFIMQGLIKFITGQSQEAINLRKRIIFKIIPMTNPDGVIAGNYRTSLSGNDLNRQFLTPNPKLHPTVDHIKKLCKSVLAHARQADPIASFIDIHGHSRKKSVFMYGPHFALHNEGYLKSKVIPKLLDDKTQMFRFYSCKFRIEKSKIKTARVVLFREFGIMNCFTLEASFHGFIDKERTTTEFTTESLEKMGEILGETLADYTDMVDQDDRQKSQVREAIKKKKKKLRAKDIAKAFLRGDKSTASRDISIANHSDTGANLEDTTNTDAGIGMAKPQSVRSLSIQNSSVGMNDAHFQTDDHNQSRYNQSHSTFAAKITNSKEAALTSDIMELISEEELSVCRSEGSPPRKTKKRKQSPQVSAIRKQQIMAEEEVEVISKKRKEMSGLRVSTGNKQSNSGTNSKGFKIRPERQKRLSDVQMAMQEIGEKKLTMSALLNQLKKHEKRSETDEESSQDDASSCDRSFSADELSESDMQQVQGEIMGVINQFDEMYNKASLKDKQAKEKVEIKTQKKLKKESKLKVKELEKQRKRTLKRDEIKSAQPATTMPFQMKGSGNGGNACTLVMQRIMEQRQSSHQQQFQAMIKSNKRATALGQESFGFMQRHKKSLNSAEKDAQIRALTEINFNVPKTLSNPDQNTQTSKINIKQVQKKRDASFTGVPVGVKGLAAISDMRNSSKNSAEIKRKKKEALDDNGEKKTKLSQRMGLKPSRMIKPSTQSATTTVTTTTVAKSPTCGKSFAVAPLVDDHQLAGLLVSVSPGLQTPKAEITESLKYEPILIKSKSKRVGLGIDDTDDEDLPQSGDNTEVKYKNKYELPGGNLDQPMIISKTTTKPLLPTFSEYTDADDREQQQQLKAQKMAKNFRVKSGSKRSRLSSNRCSSGNVAYRSQATNIVSENIPLSTLVQSRETVLSGTHEIVKKKSYLRSNPDRKQQQPPEASKTQYQSFIQQTSEADFELQSRNKDEILKKGNSAQQSSSAFTMMPQNASSYEDKDSQIQSKGTYNIQRLNTTQVSNKNTLVSLDLHAGTNQQTSDVKSKKSKKQLPENQTMQFAQSNQWNCTSVKVLNEIGNNINFKKATLTKQKTASTNGVLNLQGNNTKLSNRLVRVKSLVKQCTATSSSSMVANVLNPTSFKESLQIQGTTNGGVNMSCMSSHETTQNATQDQKTTMKQGGTTISIKEVNGSFGKIAGIQKIIGSKKKLCPTNVGI